MNTKTLTTIVIVVFGVTISSWLTPRLLRGSKEEQINKAIIAASIEINKQCPKIIDEYTRLDSVMPGNSAIYYSYTIMRIDDAEAMKSKDQMIKANTAALMAKPETRKLLDNGVSMNYLYKSSSGLKLFEFAVKL